jgi:hypothetical protein
VRLEGRLEDHELVEQQLKAAPRRRTVATAGPERYQLAVENAALDKVIDQLARRLGLEIDWDRAAASAAGIASDQLVTVKIADADLDALLSAVFKDTGLAFRREGKKVHVEPQGAR